MKSGKQRRAEIVAQRKRRKVKKTQKENQVVRGLLLDTTAPVNEASLAPNNSYGAPDFVYRGFYRDLPFTCKDCGQEEVWRATQQKWWYEVAKGFVYSTATRCRPCRRKERERKSAARSVHLDGMRRKQQLRRPGNSSD